MQVSVAQTYRRSEEEEGRMKRRRRKRSLKISDCMDIYAGFNFNEADLKGGGGEGGLRETHKRSGKD